jgi:hypothetical protein
MTDKSKTAKSGRAQPAKVTDDKSAKQRGPLLLETAITLSQLGLVITGASIFALSLQSGADFITSALRSGAAVLVVGLVLWLLNWWLARGSLAAIARQMREAAEAQATSHGKLDVNA